MSKQIKNADELIKSFGGIRPMASKMGIPVTTVQGWKKRNSIPASRKQEIIKAAQENDIDLKNLLEDGKEKTSTDEKQSLSEQSRQEELPEELEIEPVDKDADKDSSDSDNFDKSAKSDDEKLSDGSVNDDGSEVQDSNLPGDGDEIDIDIDVSPDDSEGEENQEEDTKEDQEEKTGKTIIALSGNNAGSGYGADTDAARLDVNPRITQIMRESENKAIKASNLISALLILLVALG